jgi:hypothetical protein
VKFQDYLIESWKDYKLSNSPKVLLYDFYLLSYLSSLILDPGTRKDVGLTGVGYSGKFFGREGKELDEDIQNAQRKLLPFLGTKLSQALFIAIASELRHVLDRNQQWSKFKHTDNKTFKKYIRTLRLMTDNEIKDFHPTRNLERPELEVESKGRKVAYQAAKKAIKETGGNVIDFARMSADAFKNLSWSSAYGGKAWADIAQGYIDLRQALNNYNPEAPSPSSESAEKLIAAIDHAFDLEHNTGTVLNKVNYFDVGGYNWIKKALDDKRDADMYSIASKASSDMRKLGHEVLKVAGIQDKQLKKVPAEAGIPTKKIKLAGFTSSAIQVGDIVKLKGFGPKDVFAKVIKVLNNTVEGGYNVMVTSSKNPNISVGTIFYGQTDRNIEKIAASNVVKLQGFGGKKPAKNEVLSLSTRIDIPFMLTIGSILININSSDLYIVQMVNGPEKYIKIKLVASNNAVTIQNNNPELYNGGTIARNFRVIENKDKERAFASYEFVDLSTPSRKASKAAKADEPAPRERDDSDLEVENYYVISNETLIVQITGLPRGYVEYLIIAGDKRHKRLQGQRSGMPKDMFVDSVNFALETENVSEYIEKFKNKRGSR